MAADAEVSINDVNEIVESIRGYLSKQKDKDGKERLQSWMRGCKMMESLLVSSLSNPDS